MANITEAANAYTNTLNQIGKAAGGGSSSAGADGASFGDLLKQSVQSAVDAQHKSEKVSAQALMGKADMTDVIQAISNAEIALQTVLAVRDKVVQAYNDVMRTPM